MKSQYENASSFADDPSRMTRQRVYPTYQHFCAALIQSWWRSCKHLFFWSLVLRYRHLKIYHVAAFEIQTTWRRYQSQKPKDSTALQTKKPPVVHQDEASRKLLSAILRVQRAWRRLSDYRVYESLKDTIAGFRRTGDPCLLLRTVLPRESMLLDPSMQVHVRFRLGGTRFPPSIYYRIYTHGTVVDLGAFAPRNYAAERAGEHANWYAREENNGWRPLAVRFAPGGQVKDEVEQATSRKVVSDFHFSRLKRRQDLERRRRQRTVDWMRRLYGMEPNQRNETPSTSMTGDHSNEKNFEGSSERGSLPDSEYATSDAIGLQGADWQGATSHRTSSKGSSNLLIPQPPPGPAPQGYKPRRRNPSGTGRESTPCSQPSRSTYSTGSLNVPYNVGAVVSEQNMSIMAEVQGIWDQQGDTEMDDDQLLAWSRMLDFDAYMDGWKCIATSDRSEGTLPIASVKQRRVLTPCDQ